MMLKKEQIEFLQCRIKFYKEELTELNKHPILNRKYIAEKKETIGCLKKYIKMLDKSKQM